MLINSYKLLLESLEAWEESWEAGKLEGLEA
jgi:hypothetical protein